MRSWRALLVLGASLLVLCALAGVVAFVLVPRYVEREVIRRARAQGIELELGTLEYGWQWAQISKSKARLVGVNALSLRIDDLVIDLVDWQLSHLEFNGLAVQADGPLPALVLELGAWSKRFPSAYTLPVSARNVSVSWRPAPGPAWLEVSGGTLATSPAGTVAVAEHAVVAGIDVGRVGSVWGRTETSVALGLGEAELGRAPLRMTVDLSKARPVLTLVLAPTALERLAGPLALVLPVKGVTASAVVTLEFAGREASFPQNGQALLTLDGFIPPHPVELDGFVFGKTTTLETKLAFAADERSVTLTDTRVVAGKFVLAGGGKLVREPDELRVALDLGGALPCDALAEVATESRLGRLLGRVAGKKGGALAHHVVEGSVAVRVTIEATTRDLPGAKVTRSIGIGCGLKPLTLEDLQRLGDTLLASDLSKLPAELERLTGIPEAALTLPSALPPLPKLPSALPTLTGLPSAFPGFPAPPARTAPHAPSAASSR